MRSKTANFFHGLAASYGDRAQDITRIAEQRKLGRRLVRGHPVLEAEVVYAVHHEYCETPEDFIARRSRLAFLDHRACEEALPKVITPLLICLLLVTCKAAAMTHLHELSPGTCYQHFIGLDRGWAALSSS